MPERRKHRRFSTEREVRIEHGSTSVDAVSENVGRGGIMVRANLGPHLAVGDELRVTFPTLGNVSARAEVRWIGHEDPPTIGLAFTTGFRSRRG